MNLFQMLCLALLAVLVGCSSMDLEEATRLVADEQVESGQITMPTASAPISYGDEGMMYIDPVYVDGGLYNIDEYNLCGTAQGFAMQWDPAKCDQAFGLYTAPNGDQALVTQMPFPSVFRGTPATPDAVEVDWEAGNGDNMGEKGLNDGWYNTPIVNGTPYVFPYTDCGWTHPSIYGGWDSDGKVAPPVDPSSLGEDYCDGWDTGE